MGAAMLSKGGRGKRDKNDRGPELHGTILDLNGIQLISGQ